MPLGNLRALCGREKKCSAGFQPANGPVDAKGVIQAHMPALRFFLMTCVSAVKQGLLPLQVTV